MLTVLKLLALSGVVASSETPKMEVDIVNLWNGHLNSDPPVKIKLDLAEYNNGTEKEILIDIEAPFFDDPAPPGGKMGK